MIALWANHCFGELFWDAKGFEAAVSQTSKLICWLAAISKAGALPPPSAALLPFLLPALAKQKLCFCFTLTN